MELRLETPSSPAQHAAWATIMERVSGDVFSVEELAHTFATDRESAWLLAVRDGEPVGCGVGRPSSIAGGLYAMARVLPEHRRQGVGGTIYRALSEHARGRGLTSLWGRILEEDAESRRFAEKRGFREVSREHEVLLDLADADLAGGPPPGIELVALADHPELIPVLYELDSEVLPDVPSQEGLEQMSFERWHAMYLEGPGAMPETCIIALAGGEVVGYTGMRRRGATSPIAENLLTAVRRPWRRRGIATALKRAQIARARAAGIEQIFTTNDESNVGMRGVNARLGYRPAPIRILVSGPLAT
ncbi:MAG: GNAT family N-acetyltransferase [Actinomycetota bacterium]